MERLQPLHVCPSGENDRINSEVVFLPAWKVEGQNCAPVSSACCGVILGFYLFKNLRSDECLVQKYNL